MIVSALKVLFEEIYSFFYDLMKHIMTAFFHNFLWVTVFYAEKPFEFSHPTKQKYAELPLINGDQLLASKSCK